MMKWFIPSLLAILAVSCGKTTNRGIDVTPLPAKTQLAVDKSLSAGVIPSPEQVKENQVPEVEESSCDKFRKTIPKTWFQNWIEVPEAPGDENGIKIKIFYYGKIKEGKTPLVYFNGGPGYDSHGTQEILDSVLWKVDPHEDIAFIYIDQRGTGCSSPYPTQPKAGEIDQEILVRQSHYGSRGIVEDAEAIRKKLLGDKPWISFGQSYGAFVSHRYANLYPKSLKAAFAHGGAINDSGQERQEFRILAQTRVIKKYLEAYPQDKTVIEILNKELTSDKCFNVTWDGDDNTYQICGYTIVEPLVESKLGFHDDWLRMHQWLNVMVQNNKISEKGMAFFISTFKNSFSWSDSYTPSASAAIAWVDRNTVPFDYFHCAKTQANLLRKFKVDIYHNAFHECASRLRVFNSKTKDSSASVQHLKTDHLKVSAFKKTLLDNPDLAFYIYSGEKDSFVPRETFSEEVKAMKGLGNFHYFNFLGSGHDGYYTEPRVFQDVLSVINRDNDEVEAEK